MSASERAIELTRIAAAAAAEKIADDLVALDVSEHLVITDAFLVASASNERQVRAVAEGIEEAMHKAGQKAVRREGLKECRWILLDFVEIVVHVQHNEDRQYYALERLWKDCPVIDIAEFQQRPAVGE